jgi:hypothetical protein
MGLLLLPTEEQEAKGSGHPRARLLPSSVLRCRNLVCQVCLDSAVLLRSVRGLEYEVPRQAKGHIFGRPIRGLAYYETVL